jgi:hypothetical protein
LQNSTAATLQSGRVAAGDSRLLSLILQFRGLRRANFNQARGTVVPDHATEHQDDAENEKDMNEPAHRIGSYEASDPETEEENGD